MCQPQHTCRTCSKQHLEQLQSSLVGGKQVDAPGDEPALGDEPAGGLGGEEEGG